MRAATLASGTPVTFETNGTVREARGLTSRMKMPRPSRGTANCTFIRPRTSSSRASARAWVLIASTVSAGSEWGGRQQAESPEWMPASSMCSITPPTTDVRAVGDDVDVDLDRVGQELVDQDRRVLLAGARRQALAARGLHRGQHELRQPRRVVDDLHRAPAQHVGRADHDRVADALGDLARLVQAVRGAPGGRAQVQLLEQLAEALAVLGAVDGVGAGARAA